VALFRVRGCFCDFATPDLLAAAVAFCSSGVEAGFFRRASRSLFLSRKYALNFLYAIPPPNPAAAIVIAAAIFTGPFPGARCHGHFSNGYLSGSENAQPGDEHLRAITFCYS
jgi:hypothetical protein